MERTTIVEGSSMGASFAHGYYRRWGFDSSLVRTTKKLRGRSGLRAVDPSELNIGTILTLTVYPELTLRDDPWVITGMVIEINSDIAIIRETSPTSPGITGGDYKIPIRYFIDNRVYTERKGDEE